MYIGVAGNIGCGKTTLTRMLSEYYGWTPKYEPVDVNPYLDDYYKDIKRWAFNLEVYFLKQRFKDLLSIHSLNGTVIQDRTILEGVNIFVANNYHSGDLSARDYESFMELYNLMISFIKPLDLLIYLRCSLPHLTSQIRKRNREYEKGMSTEYLENLNIRYEDWIKDYKGNILIIDKDNLDFEGNSNDFTRIISKIDEKLAKI